MWKWQDRGGYSIPVPTPVGNHSGGSETISSSKDLWGGDFRKVDTKEGSKGARMPYGGKKEGY